jgi:hypothetical protein
MVHTVSNLIIMKFKSRFWTITTLLPSKHVINLIMRIRDMGCHKMARLIGDSCSQAKNWGLAVPKWGGEKSRAGGKCKQKKASMRTARSQSKQKPRTQDSGCTSEKTTSSARLLTRMTERAWAARFRQEKSKPGRRRCLLEDRPDWTGRTFKTPRRTGRWKRRQAEQRWKTHAWRLAALGLELLSTQERSSRRNDEGDPEPSLGGEQVEQDGTVKWKTRATEHRSRKDRAENADEQ